MPHLPELKVIRTIAATQRFCRSAPKPLVLVPTMGALHRGHAALIDRARRIAGSKGTVAVSIFVNPTQFGPKEDLSRYPRTFQADRKLCREHGADLIFAPTPAEMYPEGFSTWVNEETVSLPLCGGSRPGHFRGVCTVVLKLFTITQADVAVFGLKDFQQCMVIRRMVRDLNLPIRIEPLETVREADGLALSSRNAYLSQEERAQAPVIRQALLSAADAITSGETSAARLKQRISRAIEKTPLARIDYVEISDAETFQPVKKTGAGCVIAAAVFFGKTRLIDNIWIR
jgi:pantoate--beta-alanine ligase